MIGLKKLDRYILSKFLPLFVGAFFICLFIFMMQFLWKYVDEMVGKGLELHVLGQFFFYSALTLIPLSLPLAVLLASLITFGNFGERFELLAMKAAGISLIEIMRPLIVFVSLICCVSFYFQNVIGPTAQTKLWTLLISMRQKSPELDIPEGAFYDEIDGYNLYVKRKDQKTGMLYDMLIYNFEKGFENAQVIKCDSGRLEMTADKQHLYLHLYNGEQFENLKEQGMDDQNVPFRRETFEEKHAIIEFDSDFTMVDEGIMSNQSNSKNMQQLQADIDSMVVLTDSIGRRYYNEAKEANYRFERALKRDTTATAQARQPLDMDSVLRTMPLAKRQEVFKTIRNRMSNTKSNWSFRSVNITPSNASLRKFKTAWHEKLTLSLACLIFFFIGAPLGGIIRKGGLGMPVVVSVIIFIFYYIINNTGYKMARDGKWIIWMGMWTSTAILAPIGAFLTYKSNNDSVVLNLDTYIGFVKKFLGMRSERHISSKEVIIEDPDYTTMPQRLQQLTQDCTDYDSYRNLKRAPNYFQLWFMQAIDEKVEGINARMEAIIEELSNTRNRRILAHINKYPIISERAHVRPFKDNRLNALCGLVFPVGIFLYFRIWMFRIRLLKDLEDIKAVNSQIIEDIACMTAEEKLNNNKQI